MGAPTSRRDQVISLLTSVGLALDDDDIADRLSMNRHYVNQICRTLAAQGVIVRNEGRAGKYVNQIAQDSPPSHHRTVTTAEAVPRPHSKRSDRARHNVEALIDQFTDSVDAFEASAAFPGPSLYFHERALATRRRHATAASLLADDQFLDYVYAVLPAWGMHRMGKQAAKVVEFADFATSFRAAAKPIQELWTRRITEIEPREAPVVAEKVWSIIASLRVSRSDTRIVAGSKALHHALPNLVPPIDRQYTFQFFTGQKSVPSGDERAFLEWFPYLCEIGNRCRSEVDEIVRRAGFMATGPAKAIDNAIVGYMQRRALADRAGSP